MQNAANTNRLLAFAAIRASALLMLLAGSAVHAQQQKRPAPPSPRAESVRELALLSILGDEPGIKVTAVDGIPLGQGKQVGRKPVNAPPSLISGAGIWLSPGVHLLHVQYARNIGAGISFVQGNIRVTLEAGHTYLVHPSVKSDFGKVAFSLADYGNSFPVTCLPSSISAASQAGANGKPVKKVTRANIRACQQRTRT